MNKIFNPQMISTLEIVIRFIIYIIIIAATWLAVSPLINPIKVKKRYNFNATEKEKNKFFKHIDMVLAVTLNAKSTMVSTTFYVGSIAAGALTFLLLHNSGQAVPNAIVGSFIATALPYGFLRTRLHSIRIESSYEAEGVVSEIINQYKINHENMMEAITKTVPKLKKQPWCKKALFRLATDLSGYQTKDELEDAILAFTFAIDTQWAVELGNNIFLSIEYGDDVKEAIEDILDELKDLNRINEKNKQINNESFIMIKYISPLCYLFSVFILFKNFHFTVQKFIDYQFRNDMGLKFFILTVILIVANFFVYSLVKRPKNDF